MLRELSHRVTSHSNISSGIRNRQVYVVGVRMSPENKLGLNRSAIGALDHMTCWSRQSVPRTCVAQDLVIEIGSNMSWKNLTGSGQITKNIINPGYRISNHGD